jgi:hypothetical protein
MFICMCTFILCLCCLTYVEVLRGADNLSKESYRVCLNRFSNRIWRPRRDSGSCATEIKNYKCTLPTAANTTYVRMCLYINNGTYISRLRNTPFIHTTCFDHNGSSSGVYSHT